MFLPTSAFIVLVLTGEILTAKLPPRFQKCNRDQPDLKGCMFKAAHDGLSKLDPPVEELKLPNLNPFEVAEATVGAGQGSVAIEQKFRNCKLYGFTKTEINRFEFDFERKTLEFGAVIPELNLDCEYELDGKVLLLPVKGTGHSNVILKELLAHVDFKYEELKKKGKTYVKFVSADISLDPGLITFNFENLFNGDKSLGDNINKVLNDNWREVFAEVKDSYVEIVKTILVRVFNSFFAQVSLEEALD